jgi:hypothetical protein
MRPWRALGFALLWLLCGAAGTLVCFVRCAVALTPPAEPIDTSGSLTARQASGGSGGSAGLGVGGGCLNGNQWVVILPGSGRLES